MANPSLETVAAQDFGGIARRKNTQRLWTGPAGFIQAAVTGTWVYENAKVATASALTTADAGTTNVFHIDFTGPASDMAANSGSGVVDRGTRIIGVTVPYIVGVSDIAATTCKIYQGTLSTAGALTVVELASTTTFATEATGLTQTTHLMKCVIAARDRTFVTSGNPVWCEVTVTDGTSSDVWYFGLTWHYETIEE